MGDSEVCQEYKGGTGQLTFIARIASCLLAIEKSHMAIYHGSSTDGGQPLARFGMGTDGCTQSFVSIQIGSTGHSSGKYQHISFGQCAICKQDIGHNRDAMSTGYHLSRVDRDGGYLYTCTAKNIYGGQGFNLLETIGKE